MTTCAWCQTRKGKRPCPALQGEICPTCCRKHQRQEIECPAECSYLSAISRPGPGAQDAPPFSDQDQARVVGKVLGLFQRREAFHQEAFLHYFGADRERPEPTLAEQRGFAIYCALGFRLPQGERAIEEFASKERGRLPGGEERALEALRSARFSLFEVMEAAGSRLELRDRVSGETLVVQHAKATLFEPGDGLLAWLLPTGDQFEIMSYRRRIGAPLLGPLEERVRAQLRYEAEWSPQREECDRLGLVAGAAEQALDDLQVLSQLEREPETGEGESATDEAGEAAAEDAGDAQGGGWPPAAADRAQCYVLKVGPVPLEGQPGYAYVAVSAAANTAPRVEMASADAAGLAALVADRTDVDWGCEPRLHRAALPLGITPYPPPGAAAYARAAFAFWLASGAALTEMPLLVLYEYLFSAADLWDERPWRALPDTALLRVEIQPGTGTPSTRFAILPRQEGRPAGLLMFDHSEPAQRAAERARAGDLDQIFEGDCTSVAFARGPGFARTALWDALQLPCVPYPFVREGGETRELAENDLLGLAASFQILARLEDGAGEAEAELTVKNEPTRVRVVVAGKDG